MPIRISQPLIIITYKKPSRKWTTKKMTTKKITTKTTTMRTTTINTITAKKRRLVQATATGSDMLKALGLVSIGEGY